MVTLLSMVKVALTRALQGRPLAWVLFVPGGFSRSMQPLRSNKAVPASVLALGPSRLLHFTEPGWFVDLGGWEVPGSVKLFGDFARHAVPRLAPYCTYWSAISADLPAIPTLLQLFPRSRV